MAFCQRGISNPIVIMTIIVGWVEGLIPVKLEYQMFDYLANDKQ